MLQRLDDLVHIVDPVYPLDDLIIHLRRGPSQIRVQPKRIAFLRRHLLDPLLERLEDRDGARDRLEVRLVLVPLFFGAVERVFEGVLFVRDEPGFFGCPGWVRDPFVVEDGPGEAVAS